MGSAKSISAPGEYTMNSRIWIGVSLEPSGETLRGFRKSCYEGSNKHLLMEPGGGSLAPIRMIRNFRLTSNGPIEKLQHLQLKDVPNVLVVSPCDETRSNAKLDLDLDLCMAWLRSSHLDQVDCYSLLSMIVDWIGWLVGWWQDPCNGLSENPCRGGKHNLQ